MGTPWSVRAHTHAVRMHKAVKIAVAALVVLAGPVCGEEGDASAAPASASTASVGIAGYHPVSDVKAHSEIDKDLKDIAGLGSNWADAKKIYEEGKNSGSRNLKGFSTKFKDKASMQAEPMAVLVNNYWKRYDYADAVISAALGGEDVDRLGTYKSGVLASTADARKQMVKKGLLSSTWITRCTRWSQRLPSTKEATSTCTRALRMRSMRAGPFTPVAWSKATCPDS